MMVRTSLILPFRIHCPPRSLRDARATRLSVPPAAQLLTTEWLYPHDRHFTAVPDHGSTRGMGARYAAIVRGCSLQALLLIAILAAPTSPADSGSPYLAQLASQHSGPTPSWEVTHLGKTTRKVGNHRN